MRSNCMGDPSGSDPKKDTSLSLSPSPLRSINGYNIPAKLPDKPGKIDIFFGGGGGGVACAKIGDVLTQANFFLWGGGGEVYYLKKKTETFLAMD